MGRFTQVIKAQHRFNGQIVAIKLFSEEKLAIPEVMMLVNNEINVLRNLPKNPFIIDLIETFKEDNYFYLVYDFCEGGSLLDKY